MKANFIWIVKSFNELTTEELYKILKARVEVFVVEQNCPYPDIDECDLNALHVWCELNGELAAYCRIFDVGVKYDEFSSLGRVLTTMNFRSVGLGKTLLKIAIDIVETKIQTNIKISAQDYLIKFYEDFGFNSTGNQYLEDNIPHTEMIRVKR